MAREERSRFGPRLRETLSRITEEAAHLLDAEGAGLRLDGRRRADPSSGIRPGRCRHGAGATSPRREPERPSRRNRAATDRCRHDNEPSQDLVYRAMARTHGFRSWLGVPLRDHERVMGVLVMQSRSEQRFGPADVRLLEAFAGQAAIAIENARSSSASTSDDASSKRCAKSRPAGQRDGPGDALGAHQPAGDRAARSRIGRRLPLGRGQCHADPPAWHGFGDWLGDLRIRLGEGVAGPSHSAAPVSSSTTTDRSLSPADVLERSATSAVIGEPLLYEGELRGVITASAEDERADSLASRTGSSWRCSPPRR